MTETPEERRKRLDHERYIKKRAERLRRWHDYYDMNRENILLKKRGTGVLKYGTANIERALKNIQAHKYT